VQAIIGEFLQHAESGQAAEPDQSQLHLTCLGRKHRAQFASTSTLFGWTNLCVVQPRSRHQNDDVSPWTFNAEVNNVGVSWSQKRFPGNRSHRQQHGRSSF